MDENSLMMDNDSPLGVKVNRDLLPANLRRYLEACEHRALYNTVADQLGTTRDEAKHGVMVALFDKLRPEAHRNGATIALDELFPGVMAAIRDIKRPDYRLMAHFAQRTESRFMFGHVVPRIMGERPDLFMATIHDSILTTAAEYVHQVMLDAFAEFGVKPQLKVEVYATK